ncbi:MAG: nucleotide exchange factor GrpE, partial [Kiritimatiellae bacterium]|nr:nucleotide exchange factor GrpE [Kiritimatiellia bacterium]
KLNAKCNEWLELRYISMFMKKNINTKGVQEKNADRYKELEAKIAQLAVAIDAVEDEKLIVTNQLKRALADYQNLEANSNKRVSLLYMQSRKSLAEKLIPIVDDLTMAIKSKEEIKFDQSSLAWANGVVEILNNIEKSLEDIRLRKIIPEKGSKVDPQLHEAITVIEDKIPGVIFDVIQPGYVLDDTVIRPSRVVVTKSK